MNTHVGRPKKYLTPEQEKQREEKRRKAYRNWYSRNKEDLAEKRRQRYKKDPEYRAMRKKHAVSKNEGTDIVAVYPRIGDVEYEAYKIGAVATMLQVLPSQIKYYIRKGVIPETSFPEYGLRVYTLHQVKLIARLLEDPKSVNVKKQIKKEWTNGIGKYSR